MEEGHAIYICAVLLVSTFVIALNRIGASLCDWRLCCGLFLVLFIRNDLFEESVEWQRSSKDGGIDASLVIFIKVSVLMVLYAQTRPCRLLGSFIVVEQCRFVRPFYCNSTGIMRQHD